MRSAAKVSISPLNFSLESCIFQGAADSATGSLSLGTFQGLFHSVIVRQHCCVTLPFNQLRAVYGTPVSSSASASAASSSVSLPFAGRLKLSRSLSVSLRYAKNSGSLSCRVARSSCTSRNENSCQECTPRPLRMPTEKHTCSIQRLCASLTWKAVPSSTFLFLAFCFTPASFPARKTL